MKKREFSKVIITTINITTALVVVASFALMFYTGDLSALPVIVTGCFTELASATGFYYWKAKNENMIKLGLFILLWLLFCAIILTVALLLIIRADNG